MKNLVKDSMWVAGVGLVLWLGASARAAVISPVMTAFSATKARPQGFSINGWVELSSAQNHTPLPQLVKKLAHAGHIHGLLETASGTDYHKVFVHVSTAGFTTELIAERLASGATYLVIDRVGSQGFRGLSESTSVVKHVLDPYGSLHLALTLQGTLARALSESAEETLVSQAFAAVAAKRVNGIETSQYVSVAGDSPFIHTHDELQGHPVNLQIATNYNTYLHAEQVDVGTPLVTVTY